MSKVTTLLSDAVRAAMTTASTTEFVANHDTSINNVLLADVTESVKAIPTDNIPAQEEFKLFADELAGKLADVLGKDEGITKKTVSNKRAMISVVADCAL